MPDHPPTHDDTLPAEKAPRGARPNAYRVAVWIGLSDRKCLEKLRGLDSSPRVSEGVLFRRYPVPGLTNFRQICPPPILRRSALSAHLFALLVSLWVCARVRPHLCIGISLMPHCLLAKLGQIFSRARYAAWFIGTDMYAELNRPLWRALLTPLLKTAACTLCMGENSRRALQQRGWPNSRLLVAQSAYDLDRFHPAKAPKEWDLISVGRINRPDKRLDILLDAIAIARDRLPRLRCAIVGDGPDREPLARLARTLHLEQNVAFLGRRDDVPELLNRSRVFVMTSAWEGLPTALVEAFACGLPAVVPAVGDIPLLARDHENSLLLPATEPSDVADAAVRLLTDESLYARLSEGAARSGAALRKTATVDASSKRWNEVFRLAFNHPPRAEGR